MVTRNDSLWKSLDWVTICIYLLLIVGGWFSVCGASYDYGDRDFLDFSTRAGKQFVWIICSFGLGFVLLMLEDRMYDMFAYIIYIGMIILLIVTIFIAPDTKGSRSWLVMGPVSLQPAEFAKFATALALAKYINSYSFSIKKEKCALVLGFIILLPMLLIIGQRETGSALVYLAFFLVLYREGMPGVVLFSGVCAVIYFVVGIRFDEVFIADTPTPLGEFIVLLLILGRGGDNKSQQQVVTPKDIVLVDQIAAGGSVRMTNQGRLVGDTERRAIAIVVTANERRLEVLSGFDETVVRTESFPNTSAAYETFLIALNALSR